MQSELARYLNGNTLKDKASTKTLLSNLNMLSVNQLNAQIKLGELWKSANVMGYQNHFPKQQPEEGRAVQRACNKVRLVEMGRKPLTLKTFKSGASRLWNNCPDCITNCVVLQHAKKGNQKVCSNITCLSQFKQIFTK